MKGLYPLLFSLIYLFHSSFLNASITPVPLEQRIDKAEQIVLARLNHQVSYWGEGKKNIYTLYVLDVVAYLKGEEEALQVAVIAAGGRVGQKLQVTYPRIELDRQHDYLVFLDTDNTVIDHKDYRALTESMKQCLPYAGIQGVLAGWQGQYYDIGSQAYYSESSLVKKIELQVGGKAKTPEGADFHSAGTGVGLEIQGRGPLTITSITDGTGSSPADGFIAGTTLPNNELIINGSGFGGSPGAVFFSNADNGGSDYISSSVASDLISWSDTQIRLKIPDQAGTGTVLVQDNGGTTVGSIPITIYYAVISSYSTFHNFPELTRILPKLADNNGSGGYTFRYNNDVPNTTDDFAGHTDAVAAFERALNNWRGSTGVNFDRNNGGVATDAPIRDGTQVVSFANLGAGTLGVTNLYFAGRALNDGICEQQNTRWYIEDIDIQFKSNAGLLSETGRSWNFDGDATTSGEFDFESVALHELGHAHGLGHVIASSSEVMHYAIGPATDMRSLSSSETNAGSYLMSEGIATPPCLATNPSPMTVASGLLPIELLFFEGKAQGESVVLNWQTAAEMNNDFFTLERSADGRTFQPLAQIPGAGNSHTLRNYQYIDKAPLPGNNYYRLSQTDYDGTRSIEGFVFVHYGHPENVRLRADNPLGHSRLSVYYQSESPGAVGLQFFNLAGQVVARWRQQAEEGGNQWELPVDGLLPGIYFLEAQQGRLRETVRVLKLK